MASTEVSRMLAKTASKEVSMLIAGAGGIEKYRYCGSPKVNMHELEMEETSLTETTIDGEAMENIVPEVVG